jgi:uncharacterized protein YndB with AHSA1/START domain
MSDIASDPREEAEEGPEIALEYELDAAPEKVWRAIALAAFRERWLPQADLAAPEPIASIPGVEVRYRMREEGAPFEESTVTFRIEPGLQGGTLIRVIHRIEGDARRGSANDNLRPASLEWAALGRNRHRDERSDAAIQESPGARRSPGLLRFARNDDCGSTQMQFGLAA